MKQLFKRVHFKLATQCGCKKANIHVIDFQLTGNSVYIISFEQT